MRGLEIPAASQKKMVSRLPQPAAGAEDIREATLRKAGEVADSPRGASADKSDEDVPEEIAEDNSGSVAAGG